MPYTQSNAVIDSDSGLFPSNKLGRRSILGLLSRCLVAAVIPLASLSGAVAAQVKEPPAEEAVAQSISGEEAPRAVWTRAANRELSARWGSFQPREHIARDMGVSPAAVRGRVARLGLSSRSRGALVAL
jgi:hypothetical protein